MNNRKGTAYDIAGGKDAGMGCHVVFINDQKTFCRSLKVLR